LILQPGELGNPFTVSLEPGAYWVEWHNLTTRETVKAEELKVARAENRRLTAPFANPNPAVLYLLRKGDEG
jgi:hypothetical protein